MGGGLVGGGLRMMPESSALPPQAMSAVAMVATKAGRMGFLRVRMASPSARGVPAISRAEVEALDDFRAHGGTSKSVHRQTRKRTVPACKAVPAACQFLRAHGLSARFFRGDRSGTRVARAGRPCVRSSFFFPS